MRKCVCGGGGGKLGLWTQSWMLFTKWLVHFYSEGHRIFHNKKRPPASSYSLPSLYSWPLTNAYIH